MIIYKITNKINGKIYIGQTVKSLKERWGQHHRQASYGCNLALHNAIRKYGKENFTVEQIDVARNRDELDQKEIYWIEYYNSLSPNGYNLHTGGLHHEVSDETREKQRLSHLGYRLGEKASEETRKKMSEIAKERYKDKTKHPNYGKKLSDETKAKISKAHKGKKLSLEQRELMSEQRRGEKNHNWGKPRSEETRIKIGLARKGKRVREDAANAKKVLCVETGELFGCIKDAHEKYGISHIGGCCNGQRKTAGGYHWRFAS